MENEKIILGIIIAAVYLAVSCLLFYLLFRYKKCEEDDQQPSDSGTEPTGHTDQGGQSADGGK